MFEKYPVFKKDDFSDLKMKLVYKEGVEIFYFESWEQYCNELLPKIEIQRDRNNKKILDYYLWRGQRCDNWELLSSFDRWYREKVSDRNEIHRKRLLEKRLKVFGTKLKDTTGKQYPQDECWAMAQHYGLLTPLLDWTDDPNIAAYFAFFKEADVNQTFYRAIYALSIKSKLLLRKTKNKKTKNVVAKERFIEILDRYDVQDAIENIRLKCQKGRFTKALNGDDIVTNIRRMLNKLDILRENKIILFKILIPNQERYKVLNWLKDKKDIQHTKLFPDIEGVVEACKMEVG